jgi:hypothetical protein
MINNIKLFEFSLQNPEPTMDESYFKHSDLIISHKESQPTQLMKNNFELLEAISAFSFARKNNSSGTIDLAIEKILKLTKHKNINYSEFVSFWPTLDLSHSIFAKLSTEQQKQTLKQIVEKYLDSRHELYSSHGYSCNTLQVGKDAKAHKENGSLGIQKVSKILREFGFENCDSESLSDFISGGERKFLESDKKGKKLFKKLLQHYKINFTWSETKEEKMPDLLIKNKHQIFVVEHKHVKEGGGGQDKQINEIITFIEASESQDNVHYISFLDGIYFNLLADADSLKLTKITNQSNKILKNLKKNQKNYFVNTAGFRKFLQDL